MVVLSVEQVNSEKERILKVGLFRMLFLYCLQTVLASVSLTTLQVAVVLVALRTFYTVFLPFLLGNASSLGTGAVNILTRNFV